MYPHAQDTPSKCTKKKHSCGILFDFYARFVKKNKFKHVVI